MTGIPSRYASLEEGFSEHNPSTGVLADEDDGDSDVHDGSDIMYAIEEVESAEENDSSRGATRRRTQVQAAFLKGSGSDVNAHPCQSC